MVKEIKTLTGTGSHLIFTSKQEGKGVLGRITAMNVYQYAVDKEDCLNNKTS